MLFFAVLLTVTSISAQPLTLTPKEKTLELSGPAIADVGPFTINTGIEGAKTTSVDGQNTLDISQSVSHAAGSATLRRSASSTASGAQFHINVTSQSPAWSAPVELRVTWPKDKHVRFWMPWSAPPETKPSDVWVDPLQLRDVTRCTYYYGAPPFTWQDHKAGYSPLYNDIVCMPLITIAGDSGAITLAQAPTDLILDVVVDIKPGEATLRWVHYRFTERPVELNLNAVVHEADWRPALAWMSQQYPEYFGPPDPRAHLIAGCGAYSSDEAIQDADKFRKMAFRVNWKSSFDFPYMGMFMPPIGDDERYPRFMPPPDHPDTSIAQIADYCARMRTNGFHVLSYFNVTEFGADIKGPEGIDKSLPPDQQWKNANNMLFGAMPGAALRNKEGGFWGTWGGAIATDCADPAYQAFLLDQARRHIEKFPQSDGICIDRLDWLRFPNPNADDGVSMIEGRPCRLLYSSWHAIMDKLSPIIHDSGRFIFVNNHLKRIDLLRHVDGIYCEFAHRGPGLNTTGMLCVQKPAIGWTSSVDDLKADPDALFQRHLYMGVYPTAPLPKNDHTITPDSWAETFYIDYGPMFDAIRGKQWVLTANAVEVVDRNALANVFETPEGYVVPVIRGGSLDKVHVRLRGLAPQSPITPEVLHPATQGFKRLSPINAQADTIDIDVPLIRGCALLRLPQPLCD